MADLYLFLDSHMNVYSLLTESAGREFSSGEKKREKRRRRRAHDSVINDSCRLHEVQLRAYFRRQHLLPTILYTVLKTLSSTKYIVHTIHFLRRSTFIFVNAPLPLKRKHIPKCSRRDMGCLFCPATEYDCGI